MTKILNGQHNTEKLINGQQDTENLFLYHKNVIALELNKITNGKHDIENCFFFCKKCNSSLIAKDNKW